MDSFFSIKADGRTARVKQPGKILVLAAWAVFLAACTDNPTAPVIENKTCAESADPYTVSTQSLDASLESSVGSGGWGSSLASRFYPAAHPTTSEAYVGFTRDVGDTPTATIAGVSGVVASYPNARCAGIAVTSNGFAALVFDPNDINKRTWAAVVRFDENGNVLFATDLFRSPNLEDPGTRGTPNTARFGYLSDTDELIAYFGHTQMNDRDGVRHQGGYLARVDAGGEQSLVNGWFGSHNLDQRMYLEGANSAVIGLGDAYPEGIFYSLLDGASRRPRVLTDLASAGNGATNGQLGGVVDLGTDLLIPYITNLSVDPNLNAGTWPDIDEEIADRIRQAAANGNVFGLLHLPKSISPDSELEPMYVNPDVSDSASLSRLKSAPYGDNQALLIWAEVGGSSWNRQIHGVYSMVVNGAGEVCQPKTALDMSYLPTEGDDIVPAAGGDILWANDETGVIQIIRLTPP